ncbi:Uncharacterised protein [Escherichia coli]|uniref:hypothetical protein n=1 Tax=Escherichia coli TaxID=562 RepID=UPI000DA485C9|nr:hypothetical protein [Escherichia coli]SQK88446.1 Uncharacterised protein [Escherichia coli]
MPSRRAQALKKKISTTASAQCFPRLARPLHGAVLMQVHSYTHTLPNKVFILGFRPQNQMQNHATESLAVA